MLFISPGNYKDWGEGTEGCELKVWQMEQSDLRDIIGTSKMKIASAPPPSPLDIMKITGEPY